MKKRIITVALICLPIFGFSQFKCKTVDNDFDPAYRIVYNESSDNTLLKLENVDGMVGMYIQNTAVCTGRELNVDIVYIFPNGEKEKYNLDLLPSDDGTVLVITYDLLTSEMLSSFKRSTKMKVRVNEVYCEPTYYEYNMVGSTNAINFIK